MPFVIHNMEGVRGDRGDSPQARRAETLVDCALDWRIHPDPGFSARGVNASRAIQTGRNAAAVTKGSTEGCLERVAYFVGNPADGSLALPKELGCQIHAPTPQISQRRLSDQCAEALAKAAGLPKSINR